MAHSSLRSHTAALHPCCWRPRQAVNTLLLLLLRLRCQPSQLWGVLWGFAKAGQVPPAAWMASWLAASRQQLDGFDAEGLAQSGWALAALQHVPDKLWLRGYSGMVAYRIRCVHLVPHLVRARVCMHVHARAWLCVSVSVMCTSCAHCFWSFHTAACA